MKITLPDEIIQKEIQNLNFEKRIEEEKNKKLELDEIQKIALSEFVFDCLNFDDNEYIHGYKLYQAYRYWQLRNTKIIIELIDFYNIMREKFPKIKSRARFEYFIGIKFKPEFFEKWSQDDFIQTFIKERCFVGEMNDKIIETKAKELFSVFYKWRERRIIALYNNKQAIGKKEFFNQLEKLGFPKYNKNGSILYIGGILVKSDYER